MNNKILLSILLITLGYVTGHVATAQEQAGLAFMYGITSFLLIFGAVVVAVFSAVVYVDEHHSDIL